ncbi:hypothetical protein RUM43_004393 [Polyplax serrata]|uniref:Uncharacterized protein n=1 Tax=Polyplax serrata TaxID=468196 RepID=A0AAN8SB63_POLSC
MDTMDRFRLCQQLINLLNSLREGTTMAVMISDVQDEHSNDGIPQAREKITPHRCETLLSCCLSRPAKLSNGSC